MSFSLTNFTHRSSPHTFPTSSFGRRHFLDSSPWAVLVPQLVEVKLNLEGDERESFSSSAAMRWVEAHGEPHQLVSFCDSYSFAIIPQGSSILRSDTTYNHRGVTPWIFSAMALTTTSSVLTARRRNKSWLRRGGLHAAHCETPSIFEWRAYTPYILLSSSPPIAPLGRFQISFRASHPLEVDPQYRCSQSTAPRDTPLTRRQYDHGCGG